MILEFIKVVNTVAMRQMGQHVEYSTESTLCYSTVYLDQNGNSSMVFDTVSVQPLVQEKVKTFLNRVKS
jgi:hypothetical protein